MSILAISRIPLCSVATLVTALSIFAGVSCGSDDAKPAAGSQSATPAPSAAAATSTLPGRMFPSQGNDHLADAAQPHLPYNSDPPTSGPHLPPLQRPGVYTQPFAPQALPHFMEHGGVWVLYNCPAGCDADLTALQGLVTRAVGQNRPAALAPYPLSGGRFAVAAWQYLLALDTLDATQVERFVEQHACRYNPEGGPFCAGVRGEILPSQTPPPPAADAVAHTAGGTTVPDTTGPAARTLSLFWTPLVAVTAAHAGVRSGQIAVSVHGASIVPQRPRLTAALWKHNLTHDLVHASGAFAVHLLRDDQDDLVARLGLHSGRDGDKLAGLTRGDGVGGCPLLTDSLAVYECRVLNEMDGGDMTVFLGEVMVMDGGEGAPLWWRDLRPRWPAEHHAAWDRKIAADIAGSLRTMDGITK